MFKKITNGATLPQAQTNECAGYDVYANEDVTIYAGQTKLVPLGISLNVKNVSSLAKQGFYVGLYLRSSYGAKGLVLPNGVGIIDIGYKDEIKQIVYNSNFEAGTFHIKKGDRVGQLIFHKHYGMELLDDKFRRSANRAGGFGSTGSK